MTGWTSLQVFHHDDRTDLLLDGVRPLLAGLTEDGVWSRRRRTPNARRR
jgi:hypothetical protein